MQRYIFNKLKKIGNSNIYPFHMPGHKRNKEFLKNLYEFIDLDFTEIDETDNMHKPEGIIKKSKECISKLFNSDESYFLVNGSTGGILASLLSILKPNENLLVAKNCHISVHNGIILSGANPIYIQPEIKYNIACSINPNLVKKAIDEYDFKACIITSPTYEGVTSNIKKISDILHQKNIPLIVDEAHGSHFKFSKNFPSPALEQGADIVIQSFHKTLPALTQCSVLHMKENLINKYKLEKCLSMIQTTSPSYIFMMNIEYCCYFLNNNQNFIENYINKLNILRKSLENLKNFKLLGSDILQNTTAEDFDISRITLFIKKNVNGKFVNELLLKEGIQIEMYSQNHIIAISTFCDTGYGLDLFIKSLKKIDKILDDYEDIKLDEKTINVSYIVKPKINPKEIFYCDTEEININLSENKISAEFITPYPPGIPLVYKGEVITKELIVIINNLLKNNINIIGVNNENIYVKK